jgi:CubicO group peptidase (beta-lactamase class C family)
VADQGRRGVTTSGFSAKRLTRVQETLERHVEAGLVPGAVAVIARHGEVHIHAAGTLAFEGVGSSMAMAGDTICRLASMTKPLVAACAMTLVEDNTLRLDDPVDDLLPELSDMTVLVDPNGPLDNTVPAQRPITVRDLLTFRLGTGFVEAETKSAPISAALDAVVRGENPESPGPPPQDEWIRRLGNVPLVFQPGERWMYETGADVTGVLIARATNMTFGEALRQRICDPLGMKDTAFSVPAENLNRVATAYQRDATGDLVVEDPPNGRWSRPPVFEEGGGGLVSTLNDYFAFASTLLGGGTYRGKRVLSRPSVTLMTSDHLTPAQRALAWSPLQEDISWGFGMSVRTRRVNLGPSVGSYGWSGYGNVWYNDPVEDMTIILMSQRREHPSRLPIRVDFLTAAYQAISD